MTVRLFLTRHAALSLSFFGVFPCLLASTCVITMVAPGSHRTKEAESQGDGSTEERFPAFLFLSFLLSFAQHSHSLLDPTTTDHTHCSNSLRRVFRAHIPAGGEVEWIQPSGTRYPILLRQGMVKLSCMFWRRTAIPRGMSSLKVPLGAICSL